MTATIAQLRHFIALAESGSFTRGADSTRRSQAAFSRSIAELETKLGVVLVERQGHRHSLTPIGLTVLEHARQVVAQTDELHQVVQHHVSGDAGHVRIGLGATPATLLALPLMRYARDYPGGMKIRISRALQDLQLQALRERQLDALVMDLRAVPHANGDLVVRELCEMPTGLLCRPGHALCRLDTVTVADLMAYPVAGTGVSPSVARHVVERFGAQAHPDTFLDLVSDDVGSMLQLACESDVVFVGIMAPARAHLQAGTLVQLPFPLPGMESHIAWVQRAARAPNPVLDAIHQLVWRTLRDLAPPMP